MPVSVVFGGQFGSEGKGKVACELVRSENIPIVVRVGGPNSGHTVIDQDNRVRRFQNLPTASILSETINVIAAGSYIDMDILLSEIRETGLTPDRLLIDPHAVIISDEHKKKEAQSHLKPTIGSTLSGTGAAVAARIRRDSSIRFAEADERLKPFVKNTRTFFRQALKAKKRILVEGTQGFGLSLLHAKDYPFVTSRDTSAAAFISEVGLSPRDIDQIYMVIRAYPIRVAGNSGPLPNEIDWDTVKSESGYEDDITERTTVTKKIRRIARFDADVVRRSIEANAPTRIVLNHLDYIDSSCRKSHQPSSKVNDFINYVEGQIEANIDYCGFGPASLTSRTNHTVKAKIA